MQSGENEPPRLLPDMDIERFVRVQDRKVDAGPRAQQETEYERAIRELRQGKKASQWIWFIFPRASGSGRHINSILYGIGSMKEARAYLEHPVLGPRLRAATEAVVSSHENIDLARLFGSASEAKRFRSSMTLFARALACLGTPDNLFSHVLVEFWAGAWDKKTLEKMESW